MSSVKNLQAYVLSKNDTPSWYDFSINNELLEKHLKSQCPNPSGIELIKMFMHQERHMLTATTFSKFKASKEFEEQQADRARVPVRLALQTGALLHWKISVLVKELPLPIRHQLLENLMTRCNTSLPLLPQDESSFLNLHDHALSSIILYCRSASLTIINETFKTKEKAKVPVLVGLLPAHQAKENQYYEELTRKFVPETKEHIASIKGCLEQALTLKRSLFMPGASTIKNNLLCGEDYSGDILVRNEELHAQINFDLGKLHFTHNFFNAAYERFVICKDLEKSLPVKMSGFCDYAREELDVYLRACSSIMVKINKIPPPVAPELTDQKNLYQTIESNLNGAQFDCIQVLDCIEKNIYMNELSPIYIETVEDFLLSKGLDPDKTFDVKWLCAVSRYICGLQQPVNIWSDSLDITHLERIIGLVSRIMPKINSNWKLKSNLKSFLVSLVNNVLGVDRVLLVQHMLSSSPFLELFSKGERLEIEMRFRPKPDKKLHLSSVVMPMQMGSPPLSGSGESERVVALAKVLLSSLQPQEIEDTLKQIRKCNQTGLAMITNCAPWRLASCYNFVFDSYASSPFLVDLLHAMLAKVANCTRDRQFRSARNLLKFLKQKFNQQQGNKVIYAWIQWETLKVELLEILTDKSMNFAMDSTHQQLRGSLSGTIDEAWNVINLPTDRLPPNLIELALAFLLNIEEFSSLKSPQLRKSMNPTTRFVGTLACLHHALQQTRPNASADPNAIKHSAVLFWQGMINVFNKEKLAVFNCRNGGVKLLHSCGVNAIRPAPKTDITRNQLLKLIRLIKNPKVLQTIVSALTHLYRLCRSVNVSLPNAKHVNCLWPAQLENVSCSKIAVGYVLRETLVHCLQLHPCDKNWLKVQGDLHFAGGNPLAAMRCYLLIGAYATKFFTRIKSVRFYEDETIIEKMRKCCEQLKCFTQAAVLCQFLKDADYNFAFKVLQENRKRSDAAELHYAAHVWDVQILEHAIFFHKESGEVGKRKAAVDAISRAELNQSNHPAVGERVQLIRAAHFFQALSRHYLS